MKLLWLQHPSEPFHSLVPFPFYVFFLMATKFSTERQAESKDSLPGRTVRYLKNHCEKIIRISHQVILTPSRSHTLTQSSDKRKARSITNFALNPPEATHLPHYLNIEKSRSGEIDPGVLSIAFSHWHSPFVHKILISALSSLVQDPTRSHCSLLAYHWLDYLAFSLLSNLLRYHSQALESPTHIIRTSIIHS